MPDRAWLKILLLSTLLHLLLVILFWPALRELFRDPDVLPGMQLDVTVQQRELPGEARRSPERQEEPPDEEPQPEPEPPEQEKPRPEPEPEPKPEQEMHLPRDTDETVDLEGTDVEAPEQDAPLKQKGESEQPREGPSAEPGPEEAAPSGGEEAAEEEGPQEDAGAGEEAPAPEAGMERLETPAPGGSDLPDGDSASMSLGEEVPPADDAGAPPIPGDALGGDGGIQALDDEEMDSIRGESPVSEIEERRIRMANEYLARMKRQIVAAWEQPEGASARHKGEIRFSVDSRGYLRTSRVHLPSGNKALDESALRAVRSVERYRVPDSPSIVRQYYQSLRFTYSGASINYEK